MKLPKMIAADYEPHFSLKHMFKDVQLGIHMANALDIEVPGDHRHGRRDVRRAQ